MDTVLTATGQLMGYTERVLHRGCGSSRGGGVGDANPAPVDRRGAGASRETRRPLAASAADRPAAASSGRRGTRCICDADTLDDIRRLLVHRALVYGDIGYNKGGEITIQVEQFQLLRARDELPQPHDLRGIFAKSAVTAGDHVQILAALDRDSYDT